MNDYGCTCNVGFVGDGTDCTPTQEYNECEFGEHDCNTLNTCIDLPQGQFTNQGTQRETRPQFIDAVIDVWPRLTVQMRVYEVTFDLKSPGIN